MFLKRDTLHPLARISWTCHASSSYPPYSLIVYEMQHEVSAKFETDILQRNLRYSSVYVELTRN